MIPAGIRLAATATSGLVFFAGSLNMPNSGCDSTTPTRTKPAVAHTTKYTDSRPTNKPGPSGKVLAHAPAGGTVYSRRTGNRPRVCAILDGPGQSGKRGCSTTTKTAAANCPVGLQWPTCADRSDRAPGDK